MLSKTTVPSGVNRSALVVLPVRLPLIFSVAAGVRASTPEPSTSSEPLRVTVAWSGIDRLPCSTRVPAVTPIDAPAVTVKFSLGVNANVTVGSRVRLTSVKLVRFGSITEAPLVTRRLA